MLRPGAITSRDFAIIITCMCCMCCILFMIESDEMNISKRQEKKKSNKCIIIYKMRRNSPEMRVIA